MPRENDLTGRRFGKLTAIERTDMQCGNAGAIAEGQSESVRKI